MTDYTPPRVTSANQAASFKLIEYIMHVRTNRCDCGVISRWSEIHEVWIAPDGATRTLKPWKPETGLRDTIEVAITRLPEKEIPVCWSCAPLRRTATIYTHEGAWLETLTRKHEEEAEAAKPQRRQIGAKTETETSLDIL
jgi:hypothetical protein